MFFYWVLLMSPTYDFLTHIIFNHNRSNFFCNSFVQVIKFEWYCYSVFAHTNHNHTSFPQSYFLLRYFLLFLSAPILVLHYIFASLFALIYNFSYAYIIFNHKCGNFFCRTLRWRIFICVCYKVIILKQISQRNNAFFFYSPQI